MSDPLKVVDGDAPITVVFREQNHFTWQQTSNLRLLDTYTQVGMDNVKAERLQQLWYCKETGEQRWEDIPRVSE